MRNLLIIVFLILLLFALYAVNQYYGFVHVHWSKFGIAVAAIGGPVQFLKKKLDELSAEKRSADEEFQFRTMQHKEFMRREERLNEIRNTTNSSSNNFDTNEPSFG